MKHTILDTLGLSAKPTKTPCHLRFAPTAGLGVSKAKSKIEKTAATVAVGIGLLIGHIGEVQSACNPPVYDVCFHKRGDWTTEGGAEMIVDFKSP